MSEAVFNKICKLLDENNVKYNVHTHEPIVTSEQAARVRGRGMEEGLKRGAKALIIRSEGNFYQFVIPGNRKLDMRKARKLLKTKKFTLASKDEVCKLTDCTVGSVPPFGNLWNIPVFADKHLNEEVDFSAGVHEKSITIKLADWNKIVHPIVEDVCVE